MAEKNTLNEQIYCDIQRLENDKIYNGIYPTHVVSLELISYTKIERKLLQKALNELYRNGQIEVGRTLNDKWIKSIDL
jgi:hypothetical protein